MPPSRVVFETVESQVLRDNPLGDPHVRRLPVLLPPEYDEQPQARFPTLYLLAGYTGRGANLLNEAPWEETIQQRLERLIAGGRARPMILVLPDCFTRYGGSQYLNSSAVGRYEDYLLELVAYVDAHFRTTAHRDRRAVAGKSSGGYGAMMMGMRHPETFGLVADHSGDKFFELCYRPDFPKFARAAERFKDLRAVLKDPAAIRPREGAFFELMNIAAMAACYSPNPESELGFDLPMELHTCALRPEVWARWEALDPVRLVDEKKNAEALRSLRLLYFDCGCRDEYNLHFGCRLMRRKLQRLGIPHRYEEFDGTHRATAHRYDVSLAAISDALPA